MTTTETFKTSRLDGRSDSQVVIDLCKDASAETLLSYQALGDALQTGTDTPISRQRVQQAVARANRRLLADHQRFLRVVRNVGYRLVRADEHLPIALDSKSRANRYLRRGKSLLENVRIEELTATQRKLHEGQLLVMSALIENMRESDRRHAKQEAVIGDLLKRVESLEGKK